MRGGFRVVRLASKSFKKEKYGERSNSENDWYTARAKRLKLDNYRCQEIGCGSKKSIQVHHKIPISRGGSHAMNNLITLCQSCHDNQHKHLKQLSFLKKSKRGVK
jgi:5-methylcytosine-specific restriction endonuclease McrA